MHQRDRLPQVPKGTMHEVIGQYVSWNVNSKKKSNGLSKSHFEQGMIIITIDTLPPLNILDCIW